MTMDITVLHVDDDVAFLDITAELLKTVDEDVSVISESDPTRALRRIETAGVDCVISDYDMPEMDGLELCERLRLEYPVMPYFLFTGKSAEGLVDEAFAAGATDFIRKEPGVTHFKILANRLRNATHHRRAQRRIEEASDA